MFSRSEDRLKNTLNFLIRHNRDNCFSLVMCYVLFSFNFNFRLLLLSLLFFGLFLSCESSLYSTVDLSLLRNSDQVLVSVFIDFSPNSKTNASFYRTVYDYSSADWDGLRHHLRHVLRDKIF